MARQVNPENIKPWYDRNKLLAEFMWAGYDEWKIPCAHRIFFVTEKQAAKKINGTILSHEDTIALAKFLKLTPEKYCEIFLKGVFEDGK